MVEGVCVSVCVSVSMCVCCSHCCCSFLLVRARNGKGAPSAATSPGRSPASPVSQPDTPSLTHSLTHAHSHTHTHTAFLFFGSGWQHCGLVPCDKTQQIVALPQTEGPCQRCKQARLSPFGHFFSLSTFCSFPSFELSLSLSLSLSLELSLSSSFVHSVLVN